MPNTELDSQSSVSVVVPAYNEALRITPTLVSALHYLSHFHPSFELIVVDDGSSDETCAIVEQLRESNPQLKLMRQIRNQGKGAAVKVGMLAAKGAYRLFMDADGSTAMSDLERLQNALVQGADIAIGSRALLSQETTVQAKWYRKLPGRLFNIAANTFLVGGIADTQCGFKLFSARAAKDVFTVQKSSGFSFDLELLFIARKLGLKIVEVPVNWHHEPGSKVHVARDGLKMLVDIFVFRWWHAGLGR